MKNSPEGGQVTWASLYSYRVAGAGVAAALTACRGLLPPQEASTVVLINGHSVNKLWFEFTSLTG